MGSRRRAGRWFVLTAATSLAASLGTAGRASVAGPPGLPPGLRPTEVNVTQDLLQRYGEPEVVVNARNPNNLVYMIMSEAWNYACQAAGDPACALVPGGGFAAGLF